MKSLTYKLIAVYIALFFVPCIVGIHGGLALRTVGQSFSESGAMLRLLRELLINAADSLEESARTQESARRTTDEIMRAHKDTSATLDRMHDYELLRASAIAAMHLAVIRTTSAERALLLTLGIRHLDGDTTGAMRERQLANIEDAISSMEDARETYGLLVNDGNDDEKREWASLGQLLDSWKTNHDEVMGAIGRLDALAGEPDGNAERFADAFADAYDTLFIKGRSIRDACERHFGTLDQLGAGAIEGTVNNIILVRERSFGRLEELGKDAEATMQRIGELSDKIIAAQVAAANAEEEASRVMIGITGRFRFFIVFSVIGVLLSFVLGLILTRSITQPIQNMAKYLDRIAKGDLSDDVPEHDRARSDEIGYLARSMQGMVASSRAEISMANAIAEGDYTHPVPIRSESDQLGFALRTMLRSSNKVMLHVSDSTSRVNRGAASVSAASRSLSQGVQTSASAMEEISRTIEQIDVQAHTNAGYAQSANQLASASRDAAQRGYSAVADLGAAMAEIQQSGRNIAVIAKLIDDIAFQTNLLALNAAVEAARAGRQGKGFSVVAEEVRNLSGRSAKAAREAGAMVEALVNRTKAGMLLTEKTDSELREIVDIVTRTASIFGKITIASDEQSLAMAQITKGLNQINNVIQENANASSWAAESAFALSRQANELEAVLGYFRLMDKPGQPGDPSAPPRQDEFAGSPGNALVCPPSSTMPPQRESGMSEMIPKERKRDDNVF